MNRIALMGFLCLGLAATAQEVQFDYDHSANFSNYRTYRWVDAPGPAANQLMVQNIQRAVDGQLALKGLRRVEEGGDLLVSYGVAIQREKEINGMSLGPRWNGNARLTTSTVDNGKLVVSFVDPAKQQLVWQGAAEQTLDIKKDPDKNYRNLEKAVAKLLKYFPPGQAK